MFCPKCGKELPAGSVICDGCGEHFEMELQRGKFIRAKSNTIGILVDFFHSKRHLILSVFLSVLCGVSFLCSVSSFDLEAILTFAFSLVAMIASWQLYSSKGTPDAACVKKLRTLSKLWRILSNIAYISLIVCLAILLIALSALGFMWNTVLEALSEEGAVWDMVNGLYEDDLIPYAIANKIATIGAEALLTVIIIVLIIACVIVALLIALYIVYSAMLKKSERYISELEGTCRTGEYTAKKCPGTFMMVMGIIYACLIGSTSFSISFETFDVSFGMSNLFHLAVGAYLVCLGVMLKKIHAAELKNNELIALEEAELARVARLTNEAIRAARQAAAEAESEAESEAASETASDAEGIVVEKATETPASTEEIVVEKATEVPSDEE